MKKLKLIKTLLIPIIGFTSIGTIAAVSTSCSCSPVVIVTGVSLNKESLALGIGDSDTLFVTVLPENATDKSVNWTSSDSSVATVDDNGKVTAVGEGQATIIVTTHDGGYTATCQVTVNQEIIHVIGIWLDKESLTLGEGDSETLYAAVHPENATDKSVTWTSSDSSVATVDNNGKVTAVGKGKATITVTTKDGGFTDTCQLTVNQGIIHVIGIWLNKSSLELYTGYSDTLIATVFPETATDKSVAWTSSDSSAATVDNNGKVTAISEGQTTITVTTNDGGFTDTCQVTVHQKTPVTGVSLDKESLVLVGAGDSDTLTATVHPDDASDKSVTWSSSDSSVATVDNNGKVTAVGEGSAKITVTTNDGGYQDYCDVTVVEPSTVYMCVTANADSILGLINEGGNNPNLRYSTDGKNWTKYWGPISIPTNGKIYLKGYNSTGWSQSDQNYSYFNITGNVSISGNVMGLLDNGTRTISSIPNDYCFYGLFSNSAGIASVSEDFLPSKSLKKSCYRGMFSNCTSLTIAPALPATTLAERCYHSMFSSCICLSSAPNLPANTLENNCYESMFSNCTSLTIAPNLPAHSLENNCYQGMFYGCKSLTNAPDLPATTLANSCYAHMFCDCSSLTTAPDLPATTLADHCYYEMFQYCASLNSIKIAYTGNYLDNCFYGWAQGVAHSGKFYYNGTDPITNFGFPSGWTINPY